jgi:4'-phosphopantetheinyl transferase
VTEQVDIWVVRLDRSDEELDSLYALLSGEERRRAGPPPFSPRKRRYVARQGVVRKILARCAAVPPKGLALVRSNHGKPMVAGVAGLRFSVSDSADLALVAVAGREVGVDVERIRIRPASKRAEIGTEEFFERWTRLEAKAKALGTGLIRPRGDADGLACTSLDLGRGFAGAVAVAADEVQVQLRPY